MKQLPNTLADCATDALDALPVGFALPANTPHRATPSRPAA
ncbi:hypothetical protein [Micromonospora profundi]